MRRKRYSAEFKKEAVRLMVLDGLSAPEVGQKLGVRPNLLYRWKQNHLDGRRYGVSPYSLLLTGCAS